MPELPLNTSSTRPPAITGDEAIRMTCPTVCLHHRIHYPAGTVPGANNEPDIGRVVNAVGALSASAEDVTRSPTWSSTISLTRRMSQAARCSSGILMRHAWRLGPLR
jgi:hypothetical protein